MTFVYHERRFSPSKKAYGLKQGANARKQGELALRHTRRILADPKKHTTEPVLALSKKCKKKYKTLSNQNKSVKNVFYACKLTRESSLVTLVQQEKKWVRRHHFVDVYIRRESLPNQQPLRGATRHGLARYRSTFYPCICSVYPTFQGKI